MGVWLSGMEGTAESHHCSHVTASARGWAHSRAWTESGTRTEGAAPRAASPSRRPPDAVQKWQVPSPPTHTHEWWFPALQMYLAERRLCSAPCPEERCWIQRSPVQVMPPSSGRPPTSFAPEAQRGAGSTQAETQAPLLADCNAQIFSCRHASSMQRQQDQAPWLSTGNGEEDTQGFAQQVKMLLHPSGPSTRGTVLLVATHWLSNGPALLSPRGGLELLKQWKRQA